MEETRNSQGTNGDHQKADSEPIARLLRLAGPRPEAPAEREARVRSAVQTHWRITVGRSRTRRRALWTGGALAAAVLIGGVGLAWWFETVTHPVAPVVALERLEGEVRTIDGVRLRAGQIFTSALELQTGVDGRAALRLNGVISVRLDRGSRLRVEPHSVLELRHGGIYIDTGVAEGPPGLDGPRVLVRTGQGTVRDIGTQFQIRVEGGSLRVSVREGIAGLEHGGRFHEASAGVRLTLERDGRLQRGETSLDDPEWAWIQEVTPTFEIEGTLLGDYLDWVARETGLTIQFATTSIIMDTSTVRLHGSIEGLRPDESLEAVLPTCGLRHRITGGSLVIERAD